MQGSEIITSFPLDLLANTSPCIFPLYPGYLAFLSGSQAGRAGSRMRFWYGFAVLAGVLTMMVALGAIIAALAVPIGSVLRILIPVADGLIFILGVLLVLNINPFKQIPTIQAPVLRHPLDNAFLFGLLYGPIALPCSGPLVVAVFALSLTAGETISRLFVFFWFGLGFGTPLLILSLIAVALYDLGVNWSNITL